ncbi:LysR substrate-binding domain-containing protein, partial [Enterobacter asburiae]|uniref:LysR substrate-binding domain-containing protein n=1 Tax=Enterobacter asburiae TaxID=61645 RepID=UPI001E3CA5E2
PPRSTLSSSSAASDVYKRQVQDDIREGRLVHLLPDWQPAALPVHLVYPWSRYYPARLRRFLELMRQVMPEVTGMRKPVQQP